MTEARNWDRLATKYDRSVALFDRSYPRVRELLRRDLANRDEVLEVAAGTGQFTFDIAETVRHVTATDVSSEMVARLQTKIAERGVGNIAIAVMSAYELDAEAASFDGIFCANALHVMESPERALGEFRRVLRPGGRLILPTFCHGTDLSRRALSWFLSIVSPFVAHTKFSPESLRGMVAAAGFEAGAPEVLPGKFPLAYLVADCAA